jgi:glycosyltransferase involved in cell wall biosynthesis
LKIPVIAVSQELGELLRKRFDARVTVVQNGIHSDIFYPDITKEYLDLKGPRKAVLVFMRKDYRKGFDVAIKVLSAFQEDISLGSIVVWAVGDDLETPFAVHKFGYVTTDVLRKILSCSDALLYPSRHEGLSLFVLEAMACGCPVVTTEAVQFVSNNKDALQCRIDDVNSLADKVKIVLTNDLFRKAIRTEALTTVKKYDIRLAFCRFEQALLTYTAARLDVNSDCVLKS